MRFTEQNQYTHPPAVLLNVFSDADYFLEKYRRAGAGNIAVIEDLREGNSSRITVSREVDVDVPIPAFARKYVPHQITVIQSDNWNHDSATGHLEIRFKGMPAEVHCAMKISDIGVHSVLDLAFTVHVSIPFVGVKLSEVLARDLREKFHKDSAAAQQAMDLIAPRYL
jgi:hypothetical protein